MEHSVHFLISIRALFLPKKNVLKRYLTSLTLYVFLPRKTLKKTKTKTKPLLLRLIRWKHYGELLFFPSTNANSAHE